MKAKYLIAPLATIIFTAGAVFAQEGGLSGVPVDPQDEFEGNSLSFLLQGSGFLGVYAEDISRENIGRYNLTQPRGVGVTQVVKDSPAEKAGLRKDDVILRVDGETITSVRKLNRLISEMSPDHSVRITVSRGGAEQDLTATIAKRSGSFNWVQGFPMGNSKSWRWEVPFDREGLLQKDGNFTFAFGNSRRIGVSTTELTKQLAEYFGITGGKGVLVTSVTEDGPAAKAGVKAGDVITAIDGEAVASPGDISRIINQKKEGEVSISLVRNKSPQTIRVLPKEGGGFSGGVLTRPQVGRQIVIPKIEIPTPEVSIELPQIQIPSVPSINIAMPRIRLRPIKIVVPRPI